MEELNEIIEGCKMKNQASQEKLYRQFYPVLFALCRKYFDDNHDVLTALNNGMMKVYANIEKYDHRKGLFFNWMYTIVRNAALTLLRDRKSNDRQILDDNIPDTPNEVFFENFEQTDLYYHFIKLPPATKLVCSLFYLEGFSIKEISDSLKLKQGTVKWHLSEGRIKLKSIIQIKQ